MSMARDGRFGKPARAEWPAVLRRVCPPEVWQRWLATMDRRSGKRARWIPKYLLLSWVLMGLAQPAELRQRFEVARQTLRALFAPRRRPGRSIQGLTKQTARLGVGALAAFWRLLRETVARRLKSNWCWHGWQVFAVDGSRIDAPRTRSNEEQLGCAGREGTGPQWWVTALIHIPSRLLWDWRSGPGASSERAHLREMIPALPDGSLLLADAIYVSYELLLALLQNGTDFLIRCGGNATLRIEGMQTLEELGRDAVVFLWPAKYARGWPLAVRLITLKRREGRMYLLTSVHDRTRLSQATARELYAARWECELNFRALKQTLARRRLRAGTPAVGEMELTGNLLALAILQVHAALLLRARLPRLSVARLLAILRAAIDATRHRRRTRWFSRRAATAQIDDYRRRRPKRARHWPHKKREPAPGPPKILSLTPAQKTHLSLLKAAGVWKGG
jgi:hypothetical protein